MTRKPSKYRNVKTVWNGEKFDSQAECARYRALLLLQQAGHISDLTRQVAFILAPKVMINGVRKRSLIYRADFSYVDIKLGKIIIEDVKNGAPLNAVFKMKRHLLKHLFNIDILET